MVGDGGAKVLERVGAWWLWVVGGGGRPKLSTCRGMQKKSYCFIAGIVFDAHRFRCGSDLFSLP